MDKIKMILTNGFGPDVRVYKEAKYLVGRGFDVEILCWDRENEYLDKEKETIDGIRVTRFFPHSMYGTGFKQIKSFLRFIGECKEYLKDKDYMYLHCHDLDGIIAGYFAKSKESKLIFDMHEIYEMNGWVQRFRYVARMLVNYLQKKSSYIIYVNKKQTVNVLEGNRRKLVFLPNYPEKENYVGCDKTKSGKLRISYIGGVRQYQELKNLMDACSGMDDVEVFIHGAGVAYKRLYGIKGNYDNVSITGKYDYTQSAKLYSETDILYILYPTTSKQYLISYPVKFFEAIITNTPIIVNKGTVLEDFINKHDIGFAVDGSNVNEIRELIRYIDINREILDIKTSNLVGIQYNYNWEEVVENLDMIYG